MFLISLVPVSNETFIFISVRLLSFIYLCPFLGNYFPSSGQFVLVYVT